jgi:predicted phage baseplate assembly protein
MPTLDPCGCCAPVAPATPLPLGNRPGLSAIAYRVGTHPQFKRTMLARLSDSKHKALRGLTTRDDEDFSVALLDAWASVADVLTFYQERIANESYLRTAGERLSIVELSRLIGYEPRPGVAASTYLAFTMEKVPGATEREAEALGVPSRTVLDAGIKVQSVPGPGEQPQVFETIERVPARVEWNDIRPRLTVRHPVEAGMETLYFDGLATGLKKGDGVLVTPHGLDAAFRLVTEVTLDNERQVTKVRLAPLSQYAAPSYGAISEGYRQGPGVAPFVEKYLGETMDTADLHAAAGREGFSVRQLFENLQAARAPAPRMIVFRTRAAIFGHNAPRWSALPATQRIGEKVKGKGFYPGVYADRDLNWIDNALDKYPGVGPSDTYLYLDSVYQGVVRGGWVVLKDDEETYAYRVDDVMEVTKSDFTLSAKVSRLMLDSRKGWANYYPRYTTVFAQSEHLPLARHPSEEKVVAGSEIELETFVDGIYAGHHVVVSGELSDRRGVTASEVATVLKAEHVLTTEGFTRLKLEVPLTNSYVRETVHINANVALATHGETVREVLGGGDATRAFQRFTLRQPPLTYTGAATPTGSQTTLSVRVGGLLWHEVSSFYGHGPEERIYVTRTDDEGRTTVMFGDGVTGARLPTGQENVLATYRKGSGLGGLVKASQLSQLMTRPLGVKGATNPLAPAGAAAAEDRDSARQNAPLTVLTLDRVVSLRDYEDFARAFAGIAKARATWTWEGEQRGVFVTVAGPDGAEVDATLRKNLLAAMRAAGDRNVPLSLASFDQRFFRLKAKVKVEADYEPPAVLAEVARRLREHFSFEARQFGQAVTSSEVLAAMQRVPGVVAVDLDELYRVGKPAMLNTHLPAAAPQPGATKTFGAELLTLDPSPPTLEVMP